VRYKVLWAEDDRRHGKRETYALTLETKEEYKALLDYIESKGNLVLLGTTEVG
jgi:hypothetical protein